jgi:hypothetical protein
MKPTKATATEHPTTVDTLVAISDLAVGYRFSDPTLGDIARTVSIVTRLLHIDRTERVQCENAGCWHSLRSSA